jgi:hypothetical protein
VATLDISYHPVDDPAPRGRPHAARRVLHDLFSAGISAATQPLNKIAERAEIPRQVLARMRRGVAFPATAHCLDQLRRVAAVVGYAGPIIGETLPIRHRRAKSKGRR